MAPPTIAERRPELVTRSVPTERSWMTTATSADHKEVARLFIGTALSFLAVAALQFALVRLHLLFSDSSILRPELFSGISTAAMTTVTVFFAVPLVLGILSYIAPLQIGARGVALPRLHQLSYWLYALGALAFYVSFFYNVPDTGLLALPPLSDDAFSPSGGVDAWIAGLALASLGFVCWAVNMVATLRNMRAPGMAWRRAPVLAWGARVIAWILLVAAPAMLAALTMLTIDRHFGGVFFDGGEGGEPMLYAHLSWIFFTGIHTLMVVFALAVISEIVPTFARKPLFSHGAVTGSLVAVGVLGMLAWMQNLYASPIAEGFAFFAMLMALSLLIPIGILFVVWTATMWEGAIATKAPLVLSLLALIALAFGLGGEWVTSIVSAGLLLENTVAAQQDTILVVVGFILAGFAALHYWLPKISGRTVAEGPAKLAGVLILLSAVVYGFAMFFAGLAGQPVDVFRYSAEDGVTALNVIASIAAFFLMIGIFLELANLARSYTAGRSVGHDPWKGSTLEWFALSPPPAHNFDAIPDVRSPEPLRDIREAIRLRESTFTPPAPLPSSAPPEVGQPDPGDEAGMSAAAREQDAPTADPDDIVSGQAADASDSDAAAEPESTDEPPPDSGRAAADESHEGAGLEADSASDAAAEGAGTPPAEAGDEPGEANQAESHRRPEGDDGSSVS